MLIDISKYSASLKKLWIDIFGDSEEYVSLLFDKGYTPTECFAIVDNDEVISVLYLLKGYIETDKISLEGRYLYAAATAASHRGKGLMGALIKEAQQYVKEKDISFISLVPADEGLYGYYGRFGFEPVMKNHVSVNTWSVSCTDLTTEDITLDELLSLRENITVPYFSFADKEWKYALSCLDYAGYKLCRISDDSYCIISIDGSEVLEYVSSKENFEANARKLLNGLSEGAVIASPHSLKEFCESRDNKFGMIYFADKKMRKIISGDVYMNIALD